MKKNYSLFLAAFMLLAVSALEAQTFIVKQVFVGSGGNFSDPDDFVEISSYDPNGGQTSSFGNIRTQSVQDMLIDGNFLYVAAQDSIAKFNIDTYNRVAIAAAPGVNKLAKYENKLLASFAYPNTSDFLRVYDANNLDFISVIEGISDEAAGMLVVDDALYVAVPGGWMSTTGKIALVDLSELILLKEVDMGTNAAGIFDLYLYDNLLFSVNKSAWGATSGYVTQTNTALSQFNHTLYQHALGNGTGLDNGQLFVQMDNGIGQIDLNDMSLVNASVVSPFEMSIASAELDTVNSLFYVSTTDYASVGEGLIFNLQGENTGSFDAGISPEAIAIDYRSTEGIGENLITLAIAAMPNPSDETCQLSFPQELANADWKITDLLGATVRSGHLHGNENELTIDVSTWPSGLYVAVARNSSHQGVVKLLVR